MSTNQNPGARWWKVDFHAHSPKSFDFGAEEGQRASVSTSLEDWVLAYMAAEVDAIVLSDHNTHDGIDATREVIESIRINDQQHFRDLAVFAGVELTVDGGYHLLAAFDTVTTGELVNGLIYNCQYPGERGESNATSPCSFEQVVRLITDMGGLAIPAHVDGPKGLFSHDGRSQAAIINSGLVAAAEAVTSDGAEDVRKLGWTPILGSDAHHLDDAGAPDKQAAKFPGSHFTWVKMETPNLAGLRLALSDGPDSAVRSVDAVGNPNDVRHNAIERIVVRNNGHEIAHDFSPWMNAIIGGRGVGKSTMMELLRLALGRFDDLPSALKEDLSWFSPEKPSADESRFWTESTEIEVFFRKSSKLYRLLWRGSSPQRSSIEVNDAGQWISQDGEVHERFRVLLNSQKEIYETAKEPQHLLRLIDAQPQVGYSSWREKFEHLCATYRSQMSAIAELEENIGREGRLRGDLADLKAELDLMTELRNSSAVRELDALSRAEDQRIQRDVEVRSFVETVDLALVKFDAEALSIDAPTSENAQNTDAAADERTVPEAVSIDDLDPEFDDSWQAEAEWDRGVITASQAIASAIADLKEAEQLWIDHKADSPRRARIAELEETVAKLLPEGDVTEGIAGEKPDQKYSRLTTRQHEIERSLQEIDGLKPILVANREVAASTLEVIAQHRAGLTDARASFVDSLNGDGLRLKVAAQASDSLQEDLRRLTNKPSSFDPVFGPEGMVSVVKVHKFNPKYVTALDDLKALLKEMRQMGKGAPRLAANDLSFDARFFQHLDTLDQAQFEVDVDLWFPEDELSVSHKPEGETKFRDLGQGSPGQKTAALLTLVLQIGDDPLLLDQPEDDLDNKLIYDLVVKALKRIKSKRQVIVVTHNANVVVNADAELVFTMEHSALPTAASVGSMQQDDVRNSICLIMEGGATAFEARYKRLVA